MKKFLTWLLLPALVLLLAACGTPKPDEPGTIAEVAQGTADLSILVEALQAAELVGALGGEGPFTVFAPTNAAFAAALEALGLTKEELLASDDLADILKYHVAPGKLLAADVIAAAPGTTPTLLEGASIAFAVVDGQVVLNETATVTTADVAASNGVVHIINAVLLPPSPDPDPDPEPGTIVEIAQDTAVLSTLVAALVASDLVETLEGTGPFTVFAPTNAAFAALLEAQEVEDLPGLIDKLGAEMIVNVLLYHVVAGSALSAADVIASAPATVDTAFAGNSIYYEVIDGSVVLNGSATVTMPDIEASNGIIHIIDQVLLPPTSLDVSLSGANEVPPVATTSTGSATVTLYGKKLVVDGSFSGFEIAGPGAHIHGPAAADANAGVLFVFDFDNDAQTFAGVFTLDDTQLGYFNDGLLYINLHSAANPAGEIRGQILP